MQTGHWDGLVEEVAHVRQLVVCGLVRIRDSVFMQQQRVVEVRGTDQEQNNASSDENHIGFLSLGLILRVLT